MPIFMFALAAYAQVTNKERDLPLALNQRSAKGNEQPHLARLPSSKSSSSLQTRRQFAAVKKSCMEFGEELAKAKALLKRNKILLNQLRQVSVEECFEIVDLRRDQLSNLNVRRSSTNSENRTGRP